MSGTDGALTRKTALELRDLIAQGTVSAEHVAQEHLDRIADTDREIHAFLHVATEQALEHARDIDRRLAAGASVGPLAGIPIALKDILSTKGIPTTCGSRMLENYRPVYDATVVERLRTADAVVLGKTNMDEFAMGSSGEHSAFGPTRNPWDPSRVPGGSSSGSVAAVAAGDAPLAVGTDTGGSVRQPAAFTGLVGMKPTYGTVSRYGLVAFGSSLDQAGPLARTVTDAAHLYQAIAGHDPQDSTSIAEPTPDVITNLDQGIDGLRVGVVKEFTGEGLGQGVRAVVDRATEQVAQLGATVTEVSLPHAPYGLPAYYLIAPSEASSNLSRFDGVRYGQRVDAPTSEQMMAATRSGGFGREVKRRIMIGTYALSAGYYDAYYNQAQKVRTLIARDFASVFEQVDILVGPTAPSTAFGLGDRDSDPLAMYLNDIYAVPSSLAGMPAVSIPAGLDEQGLPVGYQIMAPLMGDAVMMRAARALEAALAFDPIPRGARAVPA